MRKFAIVATVTLVLSMVGAVAVARGLPMRDMDLLALNTDSPRNALDIGGRSSLIDSSDGGGGSTGARARHGVDGSGSPAVSGTGDESSAADALPPRGIVPFEDPSSPAAPTPKRPSYRWQSLVPGAIK